MVNSTCQEPKRRVPGTKLQAKTIGARLESKVPCIYIMKMLKLTVFIVRVMCQN